jgi:hypothetical protein
LSRVARDASGRPTRPRALGSTPDVAGETPGPRVPAARRRGGSSAFARWPHPAVCRWFRRTMGTPGGCRSFRRERQRPRVGRRVRAPSRSGAHHPTLPDRVVPSRWGRPEAGARVPARRRPGCGVGRAAASPPRPWVRAGGPPGHRCAGAPASRTRHAVRQGLDRSRDRPEVGPTEAADALAAMDRIDTCIRRRVDSREVDTSTYLPSFGHLAAGATEPRGWPRSTEDRRRQARIDEGTPTP